MSLQSTQAVKRPVRVMSILQNSTTQIFGYKWPCVCVKTKIKIQSAGNFQRQNNTIRA